MIDGNQADDKIIAISPVLQGGESLPYVIDGMEGGISLAEFTGKAIQLLDNDRGFFLMVEGGKIDWACHANDAATAVREVIAFDQAVQKALDFYREHPDETLILVMADHETGGMSLGTDGIDKKNAFRLLDYQKCSVEAFAQRIIGYRSDPATTGISFEAVLDTVEYYFGLGNAMMPLSPSERELLNAAYNSSLKGIQPETGSFIMPMYGSDEPLAVACGMILSDKAGIGWTTSDHTAIPVPLRAIGTGQEQFVGYLDNTDISKKVIWMMGWD